MNCLRCGNETVGNQVFCTECLEVMKQHPVKPGTPIQIHQRKPKPSDKKQNPRQRKVNEAEQLQQYRKLIRWLTITIAVLCGAVCLMAILMILQLEGLSISDLFTKSIYTSTPWKW